MEFINRPRPRPAKDLICRRHLKNGGQSPGVCSVCLMEKLSQLSANSGSGSNTTTISSSCSSSSSLSPLSSSSDVSSYSSPVHHHHFPAAGSGGDGNALMMKSRSMAFITRRRRAPMEDEGKRKVGFWSKLLVRREKKRSINEGFMHSKTTRERVAMV